MTVAQPQERKAHPDLTAFQRDVLVVIAGLDHPCGLDVKEELTDYYDEEINHGRLYPNLDALVTKGLVAKGSHDDRTNAYSLTDQGLAALNARRDWETEYVEGEA